MHLEHYLARYEALTDAAEQINLPNHGLAFDAEFLGHAIAFDTNEDRTAVALAVPQFMSLGERCIVISQSNAEHAIEQIGCGERCQMLDCIAVRMPLVNDHHRLFAKLTALGEPVVIV
ncbi:hypothetical protein [Chthonobacter rhizosphaerae]|uniref:hypothetical protein n=1 Tax=Chthonobacter rhizosphaerae TaxID=2735553 RepID=UPI0015EE470E|nr:hypothetical protein [Chthonobacter rhizosphaerae]